MKICIFGGNGFIGSNLAKEYQRKGHKVFIYSQTKVKRFVGRGIRTIEHRIIASEREKIFFDGDRNYGYGGLKYDGRWSGVAKKIINNNWYGMGRVRLRNHSRYRGVKTSPSR